MKKTGAKPMRKDWVYRRGDLYLANLNPYKGSEQGGTRPVLVLQNDDGNFFCPTLIIAPLTTVLKKMKQPTHVYIRSAKGLTAPSIVALEQIDTIDKCRVLGYLGKISKEQMSLVEDAMLKSLGIEIPLCVEAP